MSADRPGSRSKIPAAMAEEVARHWGGREREADALLTIVHVELRRVVVLNRYQILSVVPGNSSAAARGYRLIYAGILTHQRICFCYWHQRDW